MRRREFLTGGALASGGVAIIPSPAIAQARREMRLVTDWPAGPGLQDSAIRLARAIQEGSGGRIMIEVFPAGALVKPFETFDAVAAGLVDMFHSAGTYFGSKSHASPFFAAVPFGFTADELFAWVDRGGGQELWDEAYAPFEIKPLLASSTAAQMGGWFNKPIDSPEAFNGLRYRMPGLGGEVLRRLGATVLLLSGSEIVRALKSGALDASEWNGPWLDMVLGLHQAVGYYYFPGFHEPGTGLFLGVNARVWSALGAGDRRLVETAAAAEYARSLAESNANNALWLRKLRDEGRIDIRRFNDPLLKEFRRVSEEVVAEAGAADGITTRVYESYRRFRETIMDWSDVAERAFLNARRLS